jgi:RNA polymerase sigma factor (sigma-70 family)
LGSLRGCDLRRRQTPREWTPFYAAHRDRTIGLVRVQTKGGVDDPELVAEEGWHKFYPHWKDCDNPASYIYVCMITAGNDALKAARRRPRIYSMDDPYLHTTAFAAPEKRRPPDDLEDDPWDPQLTAALQQLSPKLREFVLLDTEMNPGERSVAEIAKILGIKRVTAYARKKRAYPKLRALLPEDYLELRTAPRRGRVRARAPITAI